MSYQLADGWSSVNFVRPAHGWWRCTAPTWCRWALGLKAGNSHAGPPLRGHSAPGGAAARRQLRRSSCASEGAVIASFAERRAEIARQLAHAAAAGNACAPSTTTRCSTR
jgi:glycyl-tRNA synthetase beta chain